MTYDEKQDDLGIAIVGNLVPTGHSDEVSVRAKLGIYEVGNETNGGTKKAPKIVDHTVAIQDFERRGLFSNGV